MGDKKKKRSEHWFTPFFSLNMKKIFMIFLFNPLGSFYKIRYDRSKNRRGEQMALRILIVEDEESLASFIQTELTFEGTTFTVWAKRWPRGIDLVQSANWSVWSDFVGLDAANLWWHHGGAGEFAKKAIFPILMMTARNQTADVVTGLDVGLDDYLTKPLWNRRTVCPIRVIERRLQRKPNSKRTNKISWWQASWWWISPNTWSRLPERPLNWLLKSLESYMSWWKNQK